MRIRILSVDDNAMLREGIAAIIESQRDMVRLTSGQRRRGYPAISKSQA